MYIFRIALVIHKTITSQCGGHSIIIRDTIKTSTKYDIKFCQALLYIENGNNNMIAIILSSILETTITL